MQPANSFGVTIATYAGQNLGAGRFDRIKKQPCAGFRKSPVVSEQTNR